MKELRLSTHFVAAVLLAFVATGCAKKVKPDAEPVSPVSVGDDKQTHDSDSGSAMGLVTVHFSYDSNSIEGAEKEILERDAAILKQNLGLHVQVEGHCDQRGGSEYNLALGERRAGQVKKLLVSMGVPSSRVTTISMGKEKPLDPGDTEDAYAKNRRANFVVTATQ